MKRTKNNPFRSRAQQRWAYAALARGELTEKQLKEMKKGTNYSSLPEYVSKKGKKMARSKNSYPTRRRPSEVSYDDSIRRLRSSITARRLAIAKRLAKVHDYFKVGRKPSGGKLRKVGPLNMKNPHMPRGRVSRIVKLVKRLRPGISRRRISQVVSRDIVSDAHRRRYGRRALVKDALFEIDFRRTVRAQRIGPAFQKRAMRRIRRHPAHTRLRGLPRHVVRGWKEFTGYRPNFIATIKRSPIHGSFNGVIIRQLIGTTMHSRRRVIVRPSSGRLIYLIWSNGARTFSVVGAPSVMSELANDFARVGEPIILRHIDYIAFRYIAGRGERRNFRSTPTRKMGITFTHKVVHRAILQWNGKFGDAAIFPIRVSGARHRKLVDRAGIHI